MRTLAQGTAHQSPAAGRQRSKILIVLALLATLLSACAGVKLVADYDAAAVKSITDTSSQVFAFYDRMIEAKGKAPSQKLRYAAFADDWGKIETGVGVLMVREIAPLECRVAANLRNPPRFWQKYPQKHQATDDYSLALLPIHRDRFQRVFTAALVAERAKRLADPDSDPKLEND